MTALLSILALAYIGACIYVGWYVGTRMYSFMFGFLAFAASLAVTPFITIPLMRLNGGRF